MSAARLPILALALAVAVACAAGATEDTQIWADAGVEAPLGNGFAASLRHESRFIEDVHRYGLHNYDVGISFAASDRLSLSLHFLEEFERDGDRFRAESRPYGDAMLRQSLAGLDLSLRTRLEARLLRDRPDLVRLRERLQVVLPWPLWRGGPRPYASEEALFETDGRGFDQNRAILGLVHRRGALGVSLYGMLLSAEREDWEHTAALGLSLSWSFGAAPTTPAQH